MTPTAKTWLSILGLGATGLLFWFVSFKYKLIRDGQAEGPGALPAFSLSRAQLLFWTFNIFGALLLLVIWHGYPDPPLAQVIPNQALVLMGISVGTSFGSSLLDSANANKANASGSFWKDLLSSDGNKVDLHRFQLVIWTVVGGTIFWVNLLKNSCARIPEFDTGLLALMGISGTAYLGLKAHE